jgi:hypothetical protein
MVPTLAGLSQTVPPPSVRQASLSTELAVRDRLAGEGLPAELGSTSDARCTTPLLLRPELPRRAIVSGRSLSPGAPGGPPEQSDP